MQPTRNIQQLLVDLALHIFVDRACRRPELRESAPAPRTYVVECETGDDGIRERPADGRIGVSDARERRGGREGFWAFATKSYALEEQLASC